MEGILALLPIFYVYWASGLMVWSILQAGITGRLVQILRGRHQMYRKADLLIMATLIVCAGILFASVFLIPNIMALFAEIALIVALWYTVFLAIVSQFNIDSLVHIQKFA